MVVQHLRLSWFAGRSDSPMSRSQFGKLRLKVLLLMALLTCDVASAGTSRLYPPTKSHTGALRLAKITHIGTREEILKLGDHLQHLLDSGLKDSDLQDGSVDVGIVYCCHQSTEDGTAMWFYVPPNIPVQLGDIAVIRMGRKGDKKDPGQVNTLVEVREKKDAPDSQCSWEPKDNSMWMRVLYCKWMPAEGWTRDNGLYKTWLKRASGAPVQ